MTNDITQVQNLVSQFVRGMIRTGMLMFGSIFFLFRLNTRFGLIALCAFPLIVGCMGLCLAKANPLFTRLQAQLDRIEAQNQKILRNQTIHMAVTIVLAVVVLAALAFAAVRLNAAYAEVLDACTQVDALAETLQSSLGTLDPAELDDMMQKLPGIVDQLQKLDVEALNKVLAGLPGLMENVDTLQKQADSIAGVFNSIGAIFGK